MVRKNERPSLEGLARRLEVLERENAELRCEVAALKGPDAQGDEEVRNSRRGMRLPSTFQGPVSRRALLGRAGAAAVGLVAAGVLTQSGMREARADTSFVGKVTADEIVASISGMRGFNSAQFGVGVRGEANTGVIGFATWNGGAGVSGKVKDGVAGYGVRAVGVGNDYAGLLGSNDTGTGVWGQSSETGYSAVFGQHTGSAGYGVVGDGTGNGVGVLGRNPSGAGVEGRSSRYGGRFSGSRAQLVLVPGSATGRPTTGTHTKGEIFLDSTATLFVCARGGKPGTWKKFTTTSG